MRKRLFSGLIFLPVAFLVAAQLAVANAQVAVTTYHYNILRTGWNNQETALTAANFPSPFGIIATVTLDHQVDAQPLIVPGLTIAGGTHDVVYVATEFNTVYAIDASSGAILCSRNLGPPVPVTIGNIAKHVGVNSTPVIDLAAHTLYVMAFINGASPVYQLHALDLSTLNDLVNSPNGVQVTASHTLTDGSTYTFNASVQRQRPALLELNHIVYAAFGGFGNNYNKTRGWVLGWDASTPGSLAPLAANELTETRATDPGVTPPFFLDSIWMSGYGLASNGTDVFFATGNSDCKIYVTPAQCPAQTTYDGITNIQESIVRLRLQGLAQPKIVSIFTPSNVLDLDAHDLDLGAGGVLLFKTGGTAYPHLAVAAGKDGRLFLLNPNSLSTPLDTQQSDPCWCGPSFFVGSDRINRIVTSQGQGKGRGNIGTVRTWQVSLSPSPHLKLEGSAPIVSGQDGGFFTAVSSDGTTAGSAIIWAVGHPTAASPSNRAAITLYAFAAAANPDRSLTQLFSAVAGAWPNFGENANIVPVVANGKVYVASAFIDSSRSVRGQLNIFGPGGTGTPFASSVAPLAGPHAVSGTILAVSGTTLTLKTRTGKSAAVDASQAIISEQVALSAGFPVTVQGSTVTATGALVATSIDRAKGTSGELWPPDQ